MMNAKKLLLSASVLTLTTFLGHTAGLFMSTPQEQTERLQIFELMKKPVILMPMGGIKSFQEVLLGANASLSVYLLVTAVCLFLFAKNNSAQSRAQIIVHCLGMLGVAALSARFFFPMPAIFLTLGAILGLFSLKAKA